MSFTRWIVFTLIGAIGLVTTTSARADTNPRVIDDGHFFKSETVQKADEQLRQLKSDTGVEIVVETFPSIPEAKRSAYDAAKDDVQQKDEFFASWARERGKELNVFGAYILIVKDPAHLHVIAGKTTEGKAFPLADQRKVRDAMLGPFKEKNYDDGLLKGIDQAREAIKRNLSGQRLQAASAKGSYDPFAVHRPAGNNTGSGGPVASRGGAPAPQATPGPRSSGSGFHLSCMWIVLIAIGVIVLFRVLGRLGGASRNYGGGSSGPGYGGGPGYGSGPGYGGPGYGPPPNRGGGFMSGLFGGLLGGAAGSYFENRMENRDQGGGVNTGNTGYVPPDTGNYGGPPDTGAGGDFGSSSSGSDFGSSGGDTGAGGDFGGGGGGGDSGGGTGGDF